MQISKYITHVPLHDSSEYNMAREGMVLVTVLLFCCVSLIDCHVSHRKHKKPNIIYILADDLGWNDVGFHNPKVKTPNINALARRGIELTNNYALPVCSPSRSSLMTGKYPSNNGMQHIVIYPECKSCVPIEHKMLPEYMKDEGYVTKYVGKWHQGYCSTDCLPRSRGIDDFRGILGGECHYFSWEHKDVLQRFVNDSWSTLNRGTHMTLVEGNDTRDMILAHKSSTQPLFMIVSPTAPHVPLEPTQSMFDVHDFLPETSDASQNRRKFLGLVSALDDLVGVTVAAVEEAGMTNNTIIVFQSDNGGSSIEPYFSGFPSYGNNYPLRNGKYSFHEGGVRVPTIYYDPRLHSNAAGTKRNFLMHISDWLPTFLQLSNRRNRLTGIDGKSQMSNLRNRYSSSDRYRVREDMLVALTTLRGTPACNDDDAAFRWRDWKLLYGRRVTFRIANTTQDEWIKPVESPELDTLSGDSCERFDAEGESYMRCLFNINDDPYEQRNLFDERPDIVSHLLTKIDAAKANIVQDVFADSLGITSETTDLIDGLYVPRHDYCVPAVDFPLRPNNASCYL